MAFIGVDFASVDGNKPVDWVAAKRAGCRFAIIRGTYSNWIDPTWKAEYQRASDAGLIVGAYLFPVMTLRSASPEDQVGAMWTACDKLGPGNMPPVLDVEFPGGIAATGRTRRELVDLIVHRYLPTMHNAWDCHPMLYTSARVWDGEDADSLDADALNIRDFDQVVECPLWLARYPYKTRISPVGDEAGELAAVDALARPPAPRWWGPDNVWIHQYQGDAIRFPGFSATTDMNRFFPLAFGDQGGRVLWAQKRLLQAEGTPGLFDAAMQEAVRAYQAKRGLLADGVVGPATFSYLAWEP